MPLAVFMAFYGFTLIHDFISREDPAWCWDYSGAWYRWQDFFKSNLGQFVWKMRHSDYNLTPFLLLQPARLLPFSSRFNYIFSVFAVYFIPVCLLAGFLMRKLFKQQVLATLPCIAMFFTFVPWWLTILRGYVDMGSLVFLILGLITIMNAACEELGNLKKAILAGCFLYISFLFRRHFLYSVVSIFLTTPFFLGALHGHDKKKAIRIAKFFSLMALTTALCFVFFQTPFVIKILSTNYKALYSGYALPFRQSAQIFLANTGVFYSFLIGAAIFAGLLQGSRFYRVFIIYCLGNAILTLGLFCRVQSPDIHHFIPVYFWVLAIVACESFILLQKFHAKKIAMLFACLGFLCIPPYSLYGSGFKIYGCSLIPKLDPVVLENFAEYKRLTRDLLRMNLTDKIYVLGSSHKFSESLFNVIAERKFGSNYIWGAHVDSRDGLDWKALDARYVIVAVPIQFHLPKKNQQVIEIPAHSLLDGSDIGRAYRETGEKYLLGNGIEARIFEKIREPTKEEKKEFYEKFLSRYPHWPGYEDLEGNGSL